VTPGLLLALIALGSARVQVENAIIMLLFACALAIPYVRVRLPPAVRHASITLCLMAVYNAARDVRVGLPEIQQTSIMVAPAVLVLVVTFVVDRIKPRVIENGMRPVILVVLVVSAALFVALLLVGALLKQSFQIELARVSFAFATRLIEFVMLTQLAISIAPSISNQRLAPELLCAAATVVGLGVVVQQY
jgi:hypothetical protein